MSKNKEYLIMATGGLGRNIMYTSLLKHLFLAGYDMRKVNVFASYPDVFKNGRCSTIFDASGRSGMVGFYGKIADMEIVNNDPYISLDYRRGEKHFVQCLAREAFGLTFSKVENPEIVLSQEDFDAAKETINKAVGSSKFIIIQTLGGTSYYSPERSMSTAFQARSVRKESMEEVVRMASSMGFKTIQYKLPTEPKVIGATSFKRVLDFRTWCAMTKLSSGFISIDSSLMHMAAAVEKPGLVFWGATNKTSLGWNIHKNITRKDTGKCCCVGCGRPNTHLFDPPHWTCKLNFECGNFSPDEILDESEKYLQYISKRS